MSHPSDHDPALNHADLGIADDDDRVYAYRLRGYTTSDTVGRPKVWNGPFRRDFGRFPEHAAWETELEHRMKNLAERHDEDEPPLTVYLLRRLAGTDDPWIVVHTINEPGEDMDSDATYTRID